MATKKKNGQKISSLTNEIQKAKAKIEKLSVRKVAMKADAIALLNKDSESKVIVPLIEKIESIAVKITEKQKVIAKAERKLGHLVLTQVEPEMEIIAILEAEKKALETIAELPKPKPTSVSKVAPVKPRAPRKPSTPKTITTDPKIVDKTPAKPRVARKPRTTTPKASTNPSKDVTPKS